MGPIVLALAASLVADARGADFENITDRPALAAVFSEEARRSFRAWPARSDAILSSDGRSLLFEENGPDGVVLKRVPTKGGAVEVIFEFESGFDHRLAAIPGEPNRILVAEGGASNKSSWSVSILDLARMEMTKLDVGPRRSDGVMTVSPSGRFVACGVNFSCWGEVPHCAAETYAVFELASRRQVGSFDLSRGGQTASEGGRQAGHTETGTRPRVVRVAWSAPDELVLVGESADGRWARTYRQEPGASRFTEVKASDSKAERVPAASTGGVQRLYRSDDALSFVNPGTGVEVSISPAAIFESREGTVMAISAGERVLVLQERRESAGWDIIEAVLLRWRK